MSRQKAQQFLTHALGIDFPYVSMGKIDSLDLFGSSELMILQLYRENKDRWKTVADIGANLGLHSILMAKLGWNVIAYEPQPNIYEKLSVNIGSNGVSDKVIIYRRAVHTADGEAEFTVVHNNLTGSHLTGFKNSYGPRSTTTVTVTDCRRIWPVVDFAKIDCEGNEAELCLTMTKEDMSHMDCILEVRNTENAARICAHFSDLDVAMWSQKNNWERVKDFSQMPMSNRDGSLFVGHNPPYARP